MPQLHSSPRCSGTRMRRWITVIVPMAVVLTDRRPKIMKDMTVTVNQQAEGFGINVLDVRVKRIDLPLENSKAIFARMRTQREQEARRIRAEGVRDAQTISAEADKEKVVILANVAARISVGVLVEASCARQTRAAESNRNQSRFRGDFFILRID